MTLSCWIFLRMSLWRISHTWKSGFPPRQGQTLLRGCESWMKISPLICCSPLKCESLTPNNRHKLKETNFFSAFEAFSFPHPYSNAARLFPPPVFCSQTYVLSRQSAYGSWAKEGEFLLTETFFVFPNFYHFLKVCFYGMGCCFTLNGEGGRNP